MDNKYKVFLESHNLNNQFSGFGQFNHHLIEALIKIDDPEIHFTIHTDFKTMIKSAYGKSVDYKLYFGARRYKIASIRDRFDIWHSLNQNTKVEPFNELPYVLTIHDVNFMNSVDETSNDKKVNQFKNKLERATAITYISEYAKEMTHKFFDIKDTSEYVIYNGNPIIEQLNLVGFIPNLQIQGDFLFSIGAFFQRKNFHLLVEMMRFLPHLNLVIAGSNTSEYADFVRKVINDHNLEERVHLIGRISEKEKQYYFKNCKAFVFPSNSEGFGLPIVEAMSFGTAVFLSKESSLPEVGGEHAFYWNKLEPKLMAEGITAGLRQFNTNQENYMEKYKQRAALFTWSNAASQYLEVYKNIINS